MLEITKGQHPIYGILITQLIDMHVPLAIEN